MIEWCEGSSGGASCYPAPSLFGSSWLSDISRMHDRQLLPHATGNICPLRQKTCPRGLALSEWPSHWRTALENDTYLVQKKKIGGYFCFNKNKRHMEEKHLIANLLFQLELETLADTWSDYFMLAVELKSSYTFQTFVMLFSYYPVSVLSTLKTNGRQESN